MKCFTSVQWVVCWRINYESMWCVKCCCQFEHFTIFSKSFMTSFIFENFGQPTCTELTALLNAVCCSEGASAILCRHSLSKFHVIYTDERCVHSVVTPFMQVFGSVKEPFGHSSRFNVMWARVASSNGKGDMPRTSLVCIFKPNRPSCGIRLPSPVWSR